MSDPLTPAGDPGGAPVTAVAFGPQGTLTEDDFAALRALGGRDLGGAVVSLVAQAALLPADIREPAEEAIGRAFTEGTADGSPVLLDAAGLVHVYRRVVADIDLDQIRVLVVKLLARWI